MSLQILLFIWLIFIYFPKMFDLYTQTFYTDKNFEMHIITRCNALLSTKKVS